MIYIPSKNLIYLIISAYNTSPIAHLSYIILSCRDKRSHSCSSFLFLGLSQQRSSLPSQCNEAAAGFNFPCDKRKRILYDVNDVPGDHDKFGGNGRRLDYIQLNVEIMDVRASLVETGLCWGQLRRLTCRSVYSERMPPLWRF